MRDRPPVSVAPAIPPDGQATADQDFPYINVITVSLAFLFLAYFGWGGGPLVALPLLILILVIMFIFQVVPYLRDRRSIVCRCLLPLLIGAIAVEAYVVLNRNEVTKDYLRYLYFHEHYNEVFYSALSTLYAIITALALVKGIEDFDLFKKNLAEEAYKVRLIDDMVAYFNNNSPIAQEAIAGLRRQLILYAANVASFRDQTNKSENLAILRACRQYIAKLVTEDENDRHSLIVMMTAHGELGTLRAKRISAASDKIPRYLILALWIMASSLIVPFMAWPIDQATQQAVDPGPAQGSIIFLMASLNSFLLLMLSDISDPFDGFWQVSLDPFKELVELLTDELRSPPATPEGQA